MAPAPGRRQFLRTAALGGAASLLALARPWSSARASGAAEALLLTCMDYRLMDEVERYMGRRGLGDKYDHVVLAGASLGALTEKYPAWGRTFWDHLDLALKLHAIRRVIVIDHRDCAAYKLILGEDLARDRARETGVHVRQLRQLRGEIRTKHPKLEVELLLMALDGRVEAVS
ncbi:MAG TPA: carbonic anhydrase [Methylomirabilota bacterium]|nr:carbonic anhydrase [Methylomirabilota bacterium]